jgi:hypothetical protein
MMLPQLGLSVIFAKLTWAKTRQLAFFDSPIVFTHFQDEHEHQSLPVRVLAIKLPTVQSFLGEIELVI